MKNRSGSTNWADCILPKGSTLQQAINSLERTACQIVLVVDDASGKLFGTLTDGDIRRAFLKGEGLGKSLDDFVNTKPFVVPQSVSKESALQIMKANSVHQLPIIDEFGGVVGIHLLDEIINVNSLPNVMVIMAGGRGTRLRPHTENCPKPMLEIRGKPILEHILQHAIADGFRHFVISLNYLGHLIEEYFADGNRFGVKIDYIKEDNPLGTAGCLSLFPSTLDHPFLVTNGDVLTNLSYRDLIEYHDAHGATATMAVRRHEIHNPFGVVRTNGIEIASFDEKPTYRDHINAGVYVLDPQALNLLDHAEYCDMPTLFERIAQKGARTIVYPMHETWIDVGRPSDLMAARLES